MNIDEPEAKLMCCDFPFETFDHSDTVPFPLPSEQSQLVEQLLRKEKQDQSTGRTPEELQRRIGDTLKVFRTHLQKKNK